jgi:hypothetical protein
MIVVSIDRISTIQHKLMSMLIFKRHRIAVIVQTFIKKIYKMLLMNVTKYFKRR